jgi:hypothetical protein
MMPSALHDPDSTGTIKIPPEKAFVDTVCADDFDSSIANHLNGRLGPYHQASPEKARAW